MMKSKYKLKLLIKSHKSQRRRVRPGIRNQSKQKINWTTSMKIQRKMTMRAVSEQKQTIQRTVMMKVIPKIKK